MRDRLSYIYDGCWIKSGVIESLLQQFLLWRNFHVLQMEKVFSVGIIDSTVFIWANIRISLDGREAPRQRRGNEKESSSNHE